MFWPFESIKQVIFKGSQRLTETTHKAHKDNNMVILWTKNNIILYYITPNKIKGF